MTNQPNLPIFLVVRIPEDDIDGSSQELFDMLSKGSNEGKLRLDGMQFDVGIVQLSHGRHPS